jgi:hypothetical protein
VLTELHRDEGKIRRDLPGDEFRKDPELLPFAKYLTKEALLETILTGKIPAGA